MTLTLAPSSTTATALSVVCNQQEWALRRFWFGPSSSVVGLRYRGLISLAHPLSLSTMLKPGGHLLFGVGYTLGR